MKQNGMANEQMTSRERWLAAARMQPVDRLPFWPKLDAAYPIAQRPPFRDMDIQEIHDWIGSDKHIGIPGCIRELRTDTSFETTHGNGTRTTVYKAPGGGMRLVRKWDEPSQSWHPVEHPIKSLDDIRLMIEVYEDATLELDEEAVEKVKARADEIGEEAVTTNGIGESALMHWVEWLAGVENAHFFLLDYREEVEALFEAIHRNLLRKAEIVAEYSPADFLYLVENTSTTLISPEQYRRYCYPHIMEYAQILKEKGRLLVLHMCGKLKALLPDLAGIPAAAFEAFTSPTLGDTTLLDGRTACPDKCLIGGTNAMLWTQSAGEIVAQIKKDLDVLPHHRGIVVTSAGVMPPLCRPETIKEVCDWVKSYPSRM